MKSLAALPDLHRAGYEVQLNFSPVVLREGWEGEWGALFEELEDALPAALKERLAAEVILLTHNAALHEVNLAWHPKAEELLWRPDIQGEKRSETGAVNLRYRTGWKGRWLSCAPATSRIACTKTTPRSRPGSAWPLRWRRTAGPAARP